MEEQRVLFEPEDPERADDARDAQVVVVEALEPVAGGAGEVGGRDDGFGIGVVGVGGR